MRSLSLLLLLGASLVPLPTAWAEDDGYQGDDYGAQGDDYAAANDDAGDDAAQEYSNGDDTNDDGYGAGDDYIKYYTDYAILPKRCIV
jgi:hypothetical protein